jgi:hypothetical protein
MCIIFGGGLERALVRRAPGRPCPADTALSNIEIDAKSSRESPIGFSLGLFESGGNRLIRIFD